jgi:WD40 repeat protein
VAFSPDGRTALSGSYDETVRLWDLATGQTLRTFSGYSGPVQSEAFSPDGNLALSGSGDNTLMLWQTDTVANLIAFIRANRYVPELPCAQRALYDVPPLCPTAESGPLVATLQPSSASIQPTATLETSLRSTATVAAYPEPLSPTVEVQP